MKRRSFLEIGCSCGALSLLNAGKIFAFKDKTDQERKKLTSQKMNHEQVKNILKFIDSSQSESVKEDIFSQLGYECFYANKFDKWIEIYKNDIQAFLDRVNIQHESKYWERLEFNENKTVLKLTGKKVEGCACAFAECPQPPKSLCHYCCKNFQQELFGALLGRKVKVKITETFLLGDERCNTLIYLE